MSRALSNKLYRNFTKGLITEASLLTYPENSCIALDNCILYRKGNISRRLGIDFEPGWRQSPYAYYQADINDYGISEYKWEAAANDINKNFLVSQIGLTIRFHDLNYQDLGAHIKSFEIDMTPFFAPNVTADEARACTLQYTSGKGYLFIVGEKFEPIIVEYLKDTDAIQVNRIYVQVRDFVGVNDGLANDEEPATLSAEHNYNLLNQGWYDAANDGSGSTIQYFDLYGGVGSQNAPAQTPITSFHTANSRYPGNNKQWWVAKDATTGAFDPALLNKFSFGSGRAPRGHFILNAFYKDRTAASGILGIPIEKTNLRPHTVAFFSGRVWFACGSSVYYSQILDAKGKAGFCYQEADPTSEDFSDLVASDGGELLIPEMGEARRLLPAAGGILVFANNGVWFIGGTAGGFSALDYSTTRVTPIGTDSPMSVVDAKDGIYWFDRVGIRAMNVKTGAGGTSFDLATISEQTIQSYYNDIPKENLPYVKSIYDPASNTIQWLFNDEASSPHSLYDSILNLDLTLQAFYPWSIGEQGPRIGGVFQTSVLNPVNNPYNSSIRDTFIKYIVFAPKDISYYVTFGYPKDYTFVDWKSSNGVGYDYLSYLESGYELLDDAMRKKEMNYVFCYFRKTEENYVADGPTYRTDNPSSCLFQTKWDWSDTNTSNKWTSKVQAYRHQRVPGVDVTDLKFDTGFPVVVSKNKVRGHGRAIQFRFESAGPGKDFDLLGWAVPYSGNTNP